MLLLVQNKMKNSDWSKEDFSLLFAYEPVCLTLQFSCITRKNYNQYLKNKTDSASINAKYSHKGKFPYVCQLYTHQSLLKENLA